MTEEQTYQIQYTWTTDEESGSIVTWLTEERIRRIALFAHDGFSSRLKARAIACQDWVEVIETVEVTVELTLDQGDAVLAIWRDIKERPDSVYTTGIIAFRTAVEEPRA